MAIRATKGNPVEIPEIGERSQHILKMLIKRYIREGQPVGSRVLSRELDRELSPATVRNAMADLEEMGLVWSPHTSAGRVPTVLGYRLFVDTLLTIDPLDSDDVARLRERLGTEQENESLLETTSSLLSKLTHLVGMVTIPRQEQATLRQVEFLALSHNQVLVILVINEKEVQNRIIRTKRRYTPSELEQAAMIDGYGRMEIFRKVIFPLILPGLAVTKPQEPTGNVLNRGGVGRAQLQVDYIRIGRHRRIIQGIKTDIR